jgi:hypothetical protein
MQGEPLIFVLMTVAVNGKQMLFIINHLACRRDTKDPLSPSVSLHCQSSLFTQTNDHDVEPSRGRSSLTTRPIPSWTHRCCPHITGHHRGAFLRLIWRVSALLLLWRSWARRDTLQQLPAPSAEAALHPALFTNQGRSSAAPSPSIPWVGALVCTSEVRRCWQDPQATLCTSCGGCNYPRVSPSTWHNKHATINGVIVYLNLLFSCLICVLFWFDLFDWLACVFWLCWWICCMKVSLFISSLVSIEFMIVVSGFLCFMSWLV